MFWDIGLLYSGEGLICQKQNSQIIKTLKNGQK